jgi:Ca2+-binding EF-hand superfamily protein
MQRTNITPQEATMKALIALAAAAALALPLTAQAQADKAKSDGGAEAMFKALDKNNDASISREEAKGTPHDKDFAKLDKSNDGKLSREEHAAAPEHSGSKAATGGTSGGSSKKY